MEEGYHFPEYPRDQTLWPSLDTSSFRLFGNLSGVVCILFSTLLSSFHGILFPTNYLDAMLLVCDFPQPTGTPLCDTNGLYGAKVSSFQHDA
ncbi:hypothetical protein J1614_005473 [Plenodomus biglobosus]|nr:hypothetical protein J1614_005473 [Plenodomus biglobosus]